MNMARIAPTRHVIETTNRVVTNTVTRRANSSSSSSSNGSRRRNEYIPSTTVRTVGGTPNRASATRRVVISPGGTRREMDAGHTDTVVNRSQIGHTDSHLHARNTVHYTTGSRHSGVVTYGDV